MKPSVETEFLLQWGSRKRLRCVRVRGNNPAQVSSSSNTSTLRRRFLTLSHKEAPSSQPTPRHTRNSEMATLRSEKEERYYSTRGLTVEENGKIMVDGKQGEDQNHHHRYENGNGINGGGKKWVWPKLCISLSSKEKEEDFMAMKGCKLPQRPKKRAKLIQRTLLLASPGAWLTDLSLERYEVREKKICKKQQKAKGLKGMGSDSIDCSDSE